MNRLFLTIACAGFAFTTALSQDATRAGQADPAIAAALQQVSARQIQSNIEKLVSFQTRLTLSAQDPQSIAAGHGIGAAREWIKSEFERYSRDCGGCLEVKTDTFTEPPAVPYSAAHCSDQCLCGSKRALTQRPPSELFWSPGTTTRAIATRWTSRGWRPGANDDASGTAVSLECARVLSKLKFPGTIIFLTVAGEEQGLNGSSHFASMAKSEGWNIAAVLNNDIVGGDRSPQQDPSLVRVFSEGVPWPPARKIFETIRGLGGENDSPSRQLARYVAQAARTYETGLKPMLVFRLDRYLRGGDHSSFNLQGFPGVRFTEFRENYNHQHQNMRTENGVEYGDLPKFVNFDYVASVARTNAATLASLAAAPGRSRQVRVVTKNLENDTTLTWEVSPGASRYEVLWRATTSPEWEHVQSGRKSHPRHASAL